MEYSGEIEVAADIIWIRLHAQGGMLLRRLRARLRMEKALFYQGIGWLAKEGKISITKAGWSEMISLRS